MFIFLSTIHSFDSSTVLLQHDFSGALSKFVLSEAQSILVNWCDKNHLLINVNKINYIFCYRQKPCNLDINILNLDLYREKLLIQDNIKILGVLMDNKLTWKCTIDKTCTKKSWASLYPLSKYVNFQTKIVFYHSLISPQRLLYKYMWKFYQFQLIY